MRIDLTTIDREQFLVENGAFCGIPAVLVTPQRLGVKWRRDTVVFRSSIWDLAGNLLSGGWKKFVNHLENPEVFPPPASLDNCSIHTKLDGSLLISDWFNEVWNFRTRGTFSSSTLGNSDDFKAMKVKYPQIQDLHFAYPNHSVLAEITSPNQKIVIDYGPQVDITLIGIVNKKDYSYLPQSELDIIAAKYGLRRPERFTFDSIEKMLADVKDWIGKEGVCLYYNGDQSIVKIKAEKYLFLHYWKSEVSSLEKLVDLWLSLGSPEYQGFYDTIATKFDYELAQFCRGNISKICDASKEMARIIEGFDRFIEKNQLKETPRKRAAEIIFGAYGKESNRASYIFRKLDGKELGADCYKKLMLQLLKK